MPPGACLPVGCGDGRAAARARLRTSCHSSARLGDVRTAQTLNRGPRQSPAKRVWWGEEEQGSDMTDAHTWASGIERTLRRRRGLCPRGKKNARSCVRSRRTQVPTFQEGVPRKMGVQGGDAYEHPPAARCSSKESPWRIFGSFLCEQKGTPVPLQPKVTKTQI